jgi:hypothetical protein
VDTEQTVQRQASWLEVFDRSTQMRRRSRSTGEVSLPGLKIDGNIDSSLSAHKLQASTEVGHVAGVSQERQE